MRKAFKARFQLCAAILILCAANQARGAIIASTSGQTDPTTNGWTLRTSPINTAWPTTITDGSYVPPFIAGGVDDNGTDAWRISRDHNNPVTTTTGTAAPASFGGWHYYFGNTPAFAAQLADVVNNGTIWTMSATIRAVDGGGNHSHQSPEIYFQVDEGNNFNGGTNNGKTWIVTVKPQAWSNTTATVNTNTDVFTAGNTSRAAGVFSWQAPARTDRFTPALADSSFDFSIYHTYQIRYDGMGTPSPADDVISYWVDGTHIAGADQIRGTNANNPAHSADSGVTDAIIIFGDNAGAGPSDAYYASVQFEVIPEPSSICLLGIAVGLIVAWRKTRRPFTRCE